MLQKKDIYYVLAIIFTVVFFGAFIIPQVTRLLLFYGMTTWLIIIIVCIIIPIFAIFLLWLIIHEIQQHFLTLDLSDEEVQKSRLVKKVFSEEDEKFIEEKMREQLDKFKFEDEDIYEIHSDLILTYVNNRLKTEKTINLKNITNSLEIPIGIVRDILLVQIADGLIEGVIENNILNCSD
ncbi:MAG: hypothetical protein HWN66_12080 [Candidatus Helarchaeota archaeon]|nr:hypothetical protein [Candidatus Helarchaeota archaeon]